MFLSRWHPSMSQPIDLVINHWEPGHMITPVFSGFKMSPSKMTLSCSSNTSHKTHFDSLQPQPFVFEAHLSPQAWEQNNSTEVSVAYFWAVGIFLLSIWSDGTPPAILDIALFGSFLLDKGILWRQTRTTFQSFIFIEFSFHIFALLSHQHTVNSLCCDTVWNVFLKCFVSHGSTTVSPKVQVFSSGQRFAVEKEADCKTMLLLPGTSKCSSVSRDCVSQLKMLVLCWRQCDPGTLVSSSQQWWGRLTFKRK